MFYKIITPIIIILHLTKFSFTSRMDRSDTCQIYFYKINLFLFYKSLYSNFLKFFSLTWAYFFKIQGYLN